MTWIRRVTLASMRYSRRGQSQQAGHENPQFVIGGGRHDARGDQQRGGQPVGPLSQRAAAALREVRGKHRDRLLDEWLGVDRQIGHHLLRAFGQRLLQQRAPPAVLDHPDDGIDKPLLQRAARDQHRCQSPPQPDEFSLQQRLNDGRLVADVLVHRGPRYPGPPGDPGVQPGLIAVLEQAVFGGIEHPPTHIAVFGLTQFSPSELLLLWVSGTQGIDIMAQSYLRFYAYRQRRDCPMTTSVNVGTGPTREEFSDRLLKGSVKKSYAPIVDIDWDAPLEPDMFYLPPKTISLYGTPLWEQMPRAQRIELSRQEFVNTLSAGIWFENILNQALLRDMMHKDPTARETHYALTELGDETRHMVMFGKAIERVGAKPVRPRVYHPIEIHSPPPVFHGSLLWVAALIGEEIFDSLQRQMMDDPELQPMVQRLMRIHVTEEARHIQFARDGLRKRSPRMRRIPRLFVANVNGVGGYFFRYLFSNPVPYRRTGLDGRTARRTARNSQHRRDVQVAGFAPLAAFLEEVG